MLRGGARRATARRAAVGIGTILQRSEADNEVSEGAQRECKADRHAEEGSSVPWQRCPAWGVVMRMLHSHVSSIGQERWRPTCLRQPRLVSVSNILRGARYDEFRSVWRCVSPSPSLAARCSSINAAFQPVFRRVAPGEAAPLPGGRTEFVGAVGGIRSSV